MTQAELHSLLRDCLVLWEVEARLESEEEGIVLTAPAGRFEIAALPADRHPARWQLQTPARTAAGRPARLHPSITALLSALRNELGANMGNRLRVTQA